MKRPVISVCIVSLRDDDAVLELSVSHHVQALEGVGGEVLVSGAIGGLRVPRSVELIEAKEEVAECRRGRLRNLSISKSQANLVLSCDSGILLGPVDWPKRLVAWAKMIAPSVSYVAGFKIISSDGKRLWDWVRVDGRRHVDLLDYGEQLPNLALGAGCLGLSRAAWEASGRFDEEAVGFGEEIEFTQRCRKERGVPIVFCDALYGIRASHDVAHAAREELS